jgi:hypothetical protein
MGKRFLKRFDKSIGYSFFYCVVEGVNSVALVVIWQENTYSSLSKISYLRNCQSNALAVEKNLREICVYIV